MYIKRIKTGRAVKLLIHKPHLATVTICYTAKAGSVNEPKGKNGLATLERCLHLRGTKHISNAEELNLEIERIGADFSSSTSKETTVFSINAPIAHAKRAVELLSDIVANPLNREADLYKEKAILEAELKEIEDNPQELIFLKFSRQMYKGTKYENTSLGKLSDISGISIDDVINFRKKTKSGIIISIGGDIRGNKDLYNEIDSFDTGKAAPNTEQFKIQRYPQELGIIKKQVQQAIFVLGSFAPSYHSKDFYTYMLLRTMLGSGAGGCANQIIREKLHLAYYAYSFFAPELKDGIGGITAGVPEQNIPDAVEAALEILEDYKGGNIKDIDLKRAKGFYEGVLRSYNESSPEVTYFYTMQLQRHGSIKSIEQIIKTIKQISKEEIQEMAKKYFKQMYITLISPSHKPKTKIGSIIRAYNATK